jgi:hypothetical protein
MPGEYSILEKILQLEFLAVLPRSGRLRRSDSWERIFEFASPYLRLIEKHVHNRENVATNLR